MTCRIGPAAALHSAGEVPALTSVNASAEVAKQSVLNGHDLDSVERAQFTVNDTQYSPARSSKRSNKLAYTDSDQKFGAGSSSSFDKPARLRICITSENLLPKVDGVTRTIAKLLEHLQKEGHEALVLGPEGGMDSYAGHEVVGTRGIPLLGVYKGLALNFARPRFIRKIREFKPDVILFVDPIWLCAQMIPLVQRYFPDIPLVASYHTNLASYATLFGFSWLTPIMWNLMRNLHSRCELTFCPSPSTARMLESQRFHNVRLWPRGVYTSLFRPEARDVSLRESWGAEPASLAPASRRSSLELPSSPPSYATSSAMDSPKSKVVLLYVGRISWEKNLRLLIEAARGLDKPSDDRPACQLVFVGDGPARAELESLCRKYGIDAVFMGYRKGEELAAAFASADLFAFPSWTETFGQVVLESLASGLPVVGLRAEGVCDLVKHGETGLLLDMDDLLPSTSAASVSASSPSSTCPPSYTPLASFKPLPENPHALVGLDAPTFSLAVSMYRSLLVDLASDHSRRRKMSLAAAEYASTKSWHDAMEMIVDGFRQVARPRMEKQDHQNASLALSRTPTLEVDIVCDSAEQDLVEADIVVSSATGSRRRKLLRFGGVFRRTGGRLRESSISLPLTSWLGRREGVLVEGMDGRARLPVDQEQLKSSPVWATKWLVKFALLSCLFYLVSIMFLRTDAIAAILA